VGGNELAAVGPDLAAVPTFVVGGPPRSGRSTTMAAIARSLARAGAGLPAVAAVITDADVALAEFRAALRQVAQPTGAVLVDDAEHLVHSEIESDLAALAKGSAGEGWALVIAGNSDALSTGLSGFVAHVRRNRCGALLSPQSIAESELVGARIPAGLLGAQPTPGRAHVHLGTGRFCTVQVPEPPATGARG
jgi:S-DNA-T family DNA segregation ATPase FtsK/SpoIIIE